MKQFNKPKVLKGFTIVELLIVIVVIGILAAITIVSFSGVTSQANVATIKSDLDSNNRKLQLYYTQYGSYPTALDGSNCPSAPVVDSNYCLKLSPGNTVSTYTGSTSTFTLRVAKGTVIYKITDSTGPISVDVPAAPTITAITTDYTQLSVAFTAGSDGGAPITNYEYSTNGGTSWTTRSPASTASPLVITGLSYNVSYPVRIRAINENGSGTQSNQIAATTPAIPSIVASGLIVNMDAANSSSYPGSGTTWTNLTGSFSGVLTNGPTFNASLASGALTFDGTNDYVGIDTSSSPSFLAWTPGGVSANQALTVEMWFKTSDNGGLLYSKPWNGSGKYNLLISPVDFSVGVAPQSNYMTYPSSLATGTWTQVVCWVNGTTMGYSVNGNQVSSSMNHLITNNSPDLGHTVTTAAIMTLYPYGSGWGGDTGHAIAGNTGVFRAYNRVLSSSEISQNFHALRTRYGI